MDCLGDREGNWKIRATLVFCVFLGACTQPIERANISPEMQRLLSERQAKRCDNFGFKPGTNAYANCQMQMAQQDRQSEMQQQALAQQQEANIRAQRMAMAKAMQEIKINPIPLPSPAPQATRCQSVRNYDGSITTDCRQQAY